MTTMAQRIDWWKRLGRLLIGKHPFLSEARAKELFADIEWDDEARERLHERAKLTGWPVQGEGAPLRPSLRRARRQGLGPLDDRR
jgi:hypothetical protein